MLKGWRTVLFNVMAAVPLVLEAVLRIAEMPEVAAVLPAEWMPWYALGVAVANVLLRAITTTPLGRKA